MAGHSHWAGIKHRKGRADKLRSKVFSKLSKEITVAAKLGSKDSDMNPRLRSAIQAARAANMPKDNIQRAINKSELNKNLNYNSLIYEGFGPEKIAIIIEALTDNKNRTASNIRTIFQKFGGNLGESGTVSHQFKQVGVIRIDKKKISDNDIIETFDSLAPNSLEVINLNISRSDFGFNPDNHIWHVTWSEESDTQKINSENVKHSKEDENNEIEFKDLDQANDIFLKPNSEQINDINHSKEKNKILTL